MEEEERKREGRLSTLHVLVELFPNPRRDLNGCQSFPVLGLVAREKLPCKGVKLAPVGPFLANNESLGHECWLRKRITNDLYTRLEKRSSLSLSSLRPRAWLFSPPVSFNILSDEFNVDISFRANFQTWKPFRREERKEKAKNNATCPVSKFGVKIRSPSLSLKIYDRDMNGKKNSPTIVSSEE